MMGMPVAPEWTEQALCAQTDPDLWFPEKGGSVREAIAICITCPVKAECLAYAVEHNEKYGVYGGVTAYNRRGMAA